MTSSRPLRRLGAWYVLLRVRLVHAKSKPDGERSEFRGSDDDLRTRFEEYICAALSAIKYSDFVAKGKQQDIAIVGAG